MIQKGKQFLPNTCTAHPQYKGETGQPMMFKPLYGKPDERYHSIVIVFFLVCKIEMLQYSNTC